jgi:hypothetical protein
MKIHLTYGEDKKEGYESYNPEGFAALVPEESVEEISGNDILEKVPDLAKFIEACWRSLRWGGECKFVGQYFTSVNSRTSPLVKRGISETSLNFASKAWREGNKFTELDLSCDFSVVGHFAVTEETAARNVDVQRFWTGHYTNTVQGISFTLLKKRPDDQKV